MFVRKSALCAVVAIAAFACGLSSVAEAGGPIGLRRGGTGLFGNYYVNGHDGLGSKAYVSPLPVPAWVGHTNYTYQPFYPHHHMWSHFDAYRRYEPGKIFPSNVTRAFYW